LKRMIALASVGRDHSAQGAILQIEMTVEAVRHTVSAKVIPLPFFNPPRKTSVPVD
jgi:glycine cleavage system aminomethyltransferase T